ncbi:MAG: carboxymuconolactone decarboxylase family protein [Solidesulfovibrio sp.]|uniref:carboxymuconolactone decarboxylase family protein n=1 Tax=Solidesulfovibrio sp. TaxID=2910990 RepID=UPI002B2158A0|nr:carboxymuconolactone decarboxylase family protein [Solidesulfovibrio sp.]MEA4858424.1 carboxymuconolactone decarboxylase family protein [Solidesulfovibrio sp.]
MRDDSLPRHYERLARNYPRFMSALDDVAVASRELGPLEEKTIQLVQLGAAAALGAETSVSSHARRAARAGATPGEISQALLALTTTIGFPAVAAALKWAEKYLDE